MANAFLIVFGIIVVIAGLLCAITNHMEHDVYGERVMNVSIPFVLMGLGVALLVVSGVSA